MNDNILDDHQMEPSNLRRRDLLPTWIKVFVWIFIVFGAVVPVALIMGLLGMTVNLALYGLETLTPFSLIGMLVIALFGLKGIVAFGLWTEKEWAVNLAIIDAIIGILICICVMVFPIIDNSGGFNISFRIELLLLFPYLIKMRKIKSEWIERIKLK